MTQKIKNKFTQYRNNPDEWIQENMDKIMAWAQCTYKTTFEYEDVKQAAYLSVIIATSVMKEKNLKGQKTFRASFIYSFHNNRPPGYYDTPLSELDGDDQGHAQTDTSYSIESTLMDIVEQIWPKIVSDMPKEDVEILTPVLGLGEYGQLSCREAAAVLSTPKSTISRRMSLAINNLRTHIIAAIPELRDAL